MRDGQLPDNLRHLVGSLITAQSAPQTQLGEIAPLRATPRATFCRRPAAGDLGSSLRKDTEGDVSALQVSRRERGPAEMQLYR